MCSIKKIMKLLMKNNPCFWARKFDENIDREIVDLIYEEIKKEQNGVYTQGRI